MNSVQFCGKGSVNLELLFSFNNNEVDGDKEGILDGNVVGISLLLGFIVGDIDGCVVGETDGVVV
eukprot:CAMPEP_0114686792 /NCGR_PEP_ID=MMETSP0191-20121206/61851_1 /TAXON_ID=126664 /ORGANISM="Sorites sp." /LENGTH=64 /DNA_ID=CAMNT_0001972667 /DNA_START=47 /DNA_END=238 /DNA_ORIENTATION=+